MRISLFIALFFFIYETELSGQPLRITTPELPESPLSNYKTATNKSQNLYNGRRYFLNDPISDEHQFYIERQWQTGSVIYDGQQFDSLSLMYDIHKDQLIIKDLHNNFLLLVVERVQAFDINQHHFKRMIPGENLPTNMSTGFYDILYDGNTKFIIRRKKDRQEKIVDMKIIPLYESKDNYYIFRHNTYWPVRKRKSVLALFPEHGRELRRLVRRKGISYRKNREQAIVEMVRYFDEISK